MDTKTSSSAAERFGQRLGRVWRHYVRREWRVINWFVVKGLPARGAITLFWIIKLAALAVLLYVAFWVALLLLFTAVSAWAARNTTSDDDQDPEWRMGLSGYGLYRGDLRIDPGSPDDD